MEALIDMATHRHLSNAPITEALIDLRVSQSPSLSVEALRKLADIARPQYPQIVERQGLSVAFDLVGGRPPAPSAANLGVNGYWCRSADGRNVVQFRVDGFTYNRLQPYTRWEEIVPEALRLWRLYESAATAPVIRIAVRYINQIKIPPAVLDLHDFLTVPPSAPIRDGQLLSAFLSRVTVDDISTGASAVVVQGLDPALAAGTDAIVLDIDAFKVNPEGLPFAPKDVEPTLGALRELKNQLFFGSLTDRALEPYI